MYADDACVVEISCCCRCCVFSVLLTYAIAVVADAVYADTACVVGVCLQLLLPLQSKVFDLKF